MAVYPKPHVVAHRHLDAGVWDGTNDVDYRGTKEQCESWLDTKRGEGDSTNYYITKVPMTKFQKIEAYLTRLFSS